MNPRLLRSERVISRCIEDLVEREYLEAIVRPYDPYLTDDYLKAATHGGNQCYVYLV